MLEPPGDFRSLGKIGDINEKTPNLLWYKDLGYMLSQKFDVSAVVPRVYDQFLTIPTVCPLE